MSRLKRLLHVATPSTCNTQQNSMHMCRSVAQHMHSTQQTGIDNKTQCAFHQEEELRRLVQLVSDHHNFTREDYEEALETALADFDSAMICYTSLAYRADLIEFSTIDMRYIVA